MKKPHSGRHYQGLTQQQNKTDLLMIYCEIDLLTIFHHLLMGFQYMTTENQSDTKSGKYENRNGPDTSPKIFKNEN